MRWVRLGAFAALVAFSGAALAQAVMPEPSAAPPAAAEAEAVAVTDTPEAFDALFCAAMTELAAAAAVPTMVDEITRREPPDLDCSNKLFEVRQSVLVPRTDVNASWLDAHLDLIQRTFCGDEFTARAVGQGWRIGYAIEFAAGEPAEMVADCSRDAEIASASSPPPPPMAAIGGVPADAAAPTAETAQADEFDAFFCTVMTALAAPPGTTDDVPGFTNGWRVDCTERTAVRALKSQLARGAIATPDLELQFAAIAGELCTDELLNRAIASGWYLALRFHFADGEPLEVAAACEPRAP